MAKCSECGKSVGIFETTCDDCKAKAVEKKKRLEAAKQAQTEQARQEAEAKLKRIEYAIGENIKQRLQTGHTIYLYETVYTPVGSILNDELLGDNLDLSSVRKLGLEGWEVVQVIPKTVGVGLTNRATGDFHSWGGGMGGNVLGVFIMLKKVLRNMDDLNQWGKLDTYIQNHIEEFAN